MKKYSILALALVFASGCSGVVAKNFKVFADPPDSTIRVVSGIDLKELKYSSPATITAGVPKDPELAAKAVLEVSRENYRTKIRSAPGHQRGRYPQYQTGEDLTGDRQIQAVVPARQPRGVKGTPVP